MHLCEGEANEHGPCCPGQPVRQYLVSEMMGNVQWEARPFSVSWCDDCRATAEMLYTRPAYNGSGENYWWKIEPCGVVLKRFNPAIDGILALIPALSVEALQLHITARAY